MIGNFVAILAVHWLADFVLQTHWQASNKSKDIEALLRHVGTYTIVLSIAVPWIFGAAKVTDGFEGFAGFLFVMLNSVLHFATDYFTSRWSSRLWAKQDWHNLFVVIGFDQLIHQVTLAVTMLLFFGPAS